MKKIFLLILIVVVAFFTWQLFLRGKISGTVKQTGHNEVSELKYEAINGQWVSREISQKRPIAVMVENHPDARPQSGISRADIVYETLAEGGVTRFEAIFQSEVVNNIGPVRSARDYFAFIADEWHALYAHVGGSNEVIDQLKRGIYKNLSDANEYYNEYNFGRVKNKTAPHNVFTSTLKLEKLMDEHKYPKIASFASWQFKNDEPASTSTASKIDIDFSRLGYEVTWKYMKDKNTYQRIIYGGPDKDAEGNTSIEAKTVIIQYVDVSEVPKDPLLHVNIDMQSGGKAVVFEDGTNIVGSWKKTNGRTRFYDQKNEEIKFNRGQIWVELVPAERAVDWQ